MNRTRKLTLAFAIVAIGLMLAWPFQRSEQLLPTPPANPPAGEESTSGDQDLLATEDATANGSLAQSTVPARVASVELEAPSESEPELMGVIESPLAEQPKGVDQQSVATESSLASADSRPAYATIDQQAPLQMGKSWPTEQRHLIRNGDTLEKLAKRYLNDEGRALEIFEMNRDLLDNPHLLPIGVELRIPTEPGRIVE